MAEKSSPSREALLAAAERLFTERGYAAVSTREIAESAGVNLGAIQYHFGSKAALFLEAVRKTMQGGPGAACLDILDNGVIGQLDAAVRLFEFVRTYLTSVLRPSGPEACRIMFREIFSDTSQEPERFDPLIKAVVEEYIRPVADKLNRLIAALLPEAPEQQVMLVAQSIVGQCSFYVTHRPFLEALRGISFSDGPVFDAAVEHIARFSLRGAGFDEEFVNKAAAAAQELLEDGA